MYSNESSFRHRKIFLAWEMANETLDRQATALLNVIRSCFAIVKRASRRNGKKKKFPSDATLEQIENDAVSVWLRIFVTGLCLCCFVFLFLAKLELLKWSDICMGDSPALSAATEVTSLCRWLFSVVGRRDGVWSKTIWLDVYHEPPPANDVGLSLTKKVARLFLVVCLFVCLFFRLIFSTYFFVFWMLSLSLSSSWSSSSFWFNRKWRQPGWNDECLMIGLEKVSDGLLSMWGSLRVWRFLFSFILSYSFVFYSFVFQNDC